MSLQVWLLLNKEGNFYNQGLSNVTFTRNSGTYNSNGKLGGCYEFSGLTGTGISASDNGFMSKYINNHSWSICVWVKSTNTNTPIMSLSFGLRFFSGSNASINLYNSTRSVYCHSGKATNDGNWHHIVATYNVTTNKITMYVDGSYSNSVNYSSGDTYSSSWSNGLFIGRDINSNTIDYFYLGALSDVRIYDHCLSPKEVHEIAKGLVLHYPMNSLEGSNNLIIGLSSGGQTTISNNLVIITGVNSDTYFDIKTSKPMISGKSYRISCLGEGFPSSSIYNFPIASQVNSSIGLLKVKNGYCELCFVANDACANAGTSITLDDNGRNPGAGIIKNLELIELDTICDCSGYCNNSTITGGLQVVNDSPRYKKSAKMNKGQISCLNPISNNIHTVSFWMKTLNWTPSDNNYYVINAGNGWFVYRDHDSPCRYTLCNPSESSVRYSSIPITNKTEWNHICTVSTGSLSKIYVNGTLMSADTVSLKNWGVNLFIIGPGYDDCILSDVRLYSTALSDDDIKELYNTSAIINNNNTLESYEFLESDTYSINKSGVLEGAEFIEQDGEVLINNTEQIFATEFTEI